MKSESTLAYHKQHSDVSNNENVVTLTINLELRIAQTLRFLALVHSTNALNNAAASTDDYNKNLEAAIQCHDDAVSLLVGVFDDEENEYDEAQSVNYNQDAANNTASNSVNSKKGDWESRQDADILSASAFSEEGLESEEDERVLITIRVPGGEKLFNHMTNESIKD